MDQNRCLACRCCLHPFGEDGIAALLELTHANAEQNTPSSPVCLGATSKPTQIATKSS